MTLSERYPNATPRPWTWEPGLADSRHIIREKNGMAVAITVQHLNPENDVNLILHAVNTYDSREELLKEALGGMKIFRDFLEHIRGCEECRMARVDALVTGLPKVYGFQDICGKCPCPIESDIAAPISNIESALEVKL